MSEHGEPAEREAEAFAEWFTNLSDTYSTSTREPGRGFSVTALTYFGSRLGHDFSSVRIHTDSHAARIAHAIGARAYTLGNDVYFAQDRFDPGSREGRRLLAHELTHVAQHREGRTGGKVVQRMKIPVMTVANVSRRSRQRW